MSKFSWRNGFSIGAVSGTCITILSLVWVVGLNYCPNEPCKYSVTTHDLTVGADPNEWTVPTVRRSTFSYDTTPEMNGQNPALYEYYDLRAQERMAHATDWIAWLTFVTGVSGVFGLVAIIYTLNLQRNANRIMQLDRRPWLSADISIVDEKEVFKYSTGVGIRVKVKCEITCHGETPVSAAFFSCTSEIVKFANISDPEFMERHFLNARSREGRIYGDVIFPGETVIQFQEVDIPTYNEVSCLPGEPYWQTVTGAVTYNFNKKDNGATVVARQVVTGFDAKRDCYVGDPSATNPSMLKLMRTGWGRTF